MTKHVQPPQPAAPQPAPAWNITEPVPAPEILVDGYASLSLHNGIIKLTCFSIQHDPNDFDPRHNGQQHRINLRLAIPLAGAVGFVQALGSELGRINAAMAEQQAEAMKAAQEAMAGATAENEA